MKLVRKQGCYFFDTVVIAHKSFNMPFVSHSIGYNLVSTDRNQFFFVVMTDNFLINKLLTLFSVRSYLIDLFESGLEIRVLFCDAVVIAKPKFNSLDFLLNATDRNQTLFLFLQLIIFSSNC